MDILHVNVVEDKTILGLSPAGHRAKIMLGAFEHLLRPFLPKTGGNASGDNNQGNRELA
jgi:hypothetical protein